MELLTGTDAATQLAGRETVDDVDAVFDAFMAGGQVPGYVTNTADWPSITIKGDGHTLEVPVIPDYWGVGTNADPLRAGKTSEFFAQKVADNYDAVLPSEKLLRDIQAQANPKLAYIAVQNASGGADDSTAGMIKANAKANAALSAAGVTPGDGKLVIGYRKGYVVRPALNGDYIAIYGGRWDSSGKIVQPTSGHAHTSGRIAGTPNYSDYSHGIVLVSRQATLDGENVDLRDLFLSKDPTIVALVSSEGRFDPTFPNAGSGVVSKMAYSMGADGEDTSTPAGRAAAAKSATNSVATISGAFVGLGAALALSLNPLAAVASGVTGAILGRIFGGAFFGPGTANVSGHRHGVAGVPCEHCAH
jgi:hypothetical protein